MRFVLAAILLFACSRDSPPDGFFSTMEKLTVEVAYEPNAEPYTGQFGAPAPPTFFGRAYWDITEENLKSLFEGRPKAVTVTVPKALADMGALPAQNQTGWSAEEIKVLWEAHRKNTSTATHAYLFVAFLPGNFEQDGQIKNGVLGVHLGGLPVMAVFKDVVKSASIGLFSEQIRRYVEQATVVHELGHALGLVNNGTPMVKPHQDTEHGAHCTNTDCVMYWQNEGTSGLVNFVVAAEKSGSLVLFKEECLADTRAYRP